MHAVNASVSRKAVYMVDAVSCRHRSLVTANHIAANNDTALCIEDRIAADAGQRLQWLYREIRYRRGRVSHGYVIRRLIEQSRRKAKLLTVVTIAPDVTKVKKGAKSLAGIFAAKK